MQEKPTRIMYIMDYFYGLQGGTEVQVMQLLLKLDKKRFEPSICFLQPMEYVRKNEFPCPVQILNIKRLLSVNTFKKFLKFSVFLKKSKIKLVHIFFNDSALIVPFFAKLGGAKVIASRRDMGFWHTPTKLALLRFSNRFVDRIVANANAVRENVAVKEHFLPSNIEVIYNGFEPDRFTESAKEDPLVSIGLANGDQIVGMVSNLYEIKRPFDLISAFSLIANTFYKSHLVFVGGGPREINPLRQLVDDLNLQGRVHFLGRIPEPVNIIKHFSVCVLCSDSEGLSNAILEYLGCGKPVVCTNTGGNPELIQDGYNGFLVDVGDVQGLSARISQLLSDSKLAKEISSNAKRSFGQQFTAEKMAQSYMSLYDSLIGVN